MPRKSTNDELPFDLAARSRALAGLPPGIEDPKVRAALLDALKRPRP